MSMLMETKLKTEDRILKQRVAIMKDPRFIAIAGVIMIGSWKVIDAPITAATNGKNVVYGRKFIDGLDDPTLRFVILHEYYHVLLMHLIVWKDLWGKYEVDDSNGNVVDLANIAADMVINIMLDKAAGAKADGFLKVWEHAALDYQYEGMDTGEVFRKMIQQAQQNSGSGSGGNGKGGLKLKTKSASGGNAKPMDGHEVNDGTDVGDGIDEDSLCGGKLSEEELKALKGQIDEALRQGKQIAGKVGGKFDRSLEGLLETTVNWQEVLQDFVKTHAAGSDLSTWRRPARKWMSRDIYLPSHYSEAAKRITIGVDTSGSISNAQLAKALGEIKGACESVNPECVDIIYWDFDVARHEVYEANDVATLTESTKPAGGGGTRVGSMLRYMNNKNIKPDCIIIFTDGWVESDWGASEGSWPAPVLWCISSQGITAPTGKSLYVPVD